MIIIDTALNQCIKANNPVKVALVGAGFMGRAITNQIVNSVRGIELVAISNRTMTNAARSWREAGISNFKTVSNLSMLNDCIINKIPVIIEDALMLCEAEGIDVLIEATGAIEFGAKFAMKAIEYSKDVVTMNAELDATLGSIICQYADKAGLIFSLSDGDQPGVQMNLHRFVKSIGFNPLVCGNIKGLQDCYRNPTTQKEFAEKWGQNPYMVTSFADGSKISFEQSCVANATGMSVEMRGMRGSNFEDHIDNLCNCNNYNIDILQSLGGVVDYTVKSKPSPGVFVLATHDDIKQRHMLNLYKMGPGPIYSFYTPYHLCHFEVPLSVARVALFRDSVLSAKSPSVDVVALAKRDLKAGDYIDTIGGYDTYGECEKYLISLAENLLPQGLAEGCRIKHDLPKNSVIKYDDVDLPKGRVCDILRAEQNKLFPVIKTLPS